MSKKIFVIFFGTLFILAAASAGFAQGYPSKPIRMVVPFAAGGANDLVGRALQKSLGKELKTTIVVENIPGGSTKMGTLELLKSDPDGYTLMLAGHAALQGYYYSGTYDSKVWEKMSAIGQSGETRPASSRSAPSLPSRPGTIWPSTPSRTPGN